MRNSERLYNFTTIVKSLPHRFTHRFTKVIAIIHELIYFLSKRCGCSLQFIAHADGLEVCLAARLRNEGG